MQEDTAQKNQYGEEINLIELFRKIIESKNIIIVTTLIFTISAFIFSLQSKPSYQSSVLIEIGHYGSNVGTKSLIEDPSSLIKDLKIRIYKDENKSIENVEFIPLEDKLINIKYKSNFTEENISFLNEVTSFIENRHSLFIEDKKENINNQIAKYEKLLQLSNLNNTELINTSQESINTENLSEIQNFIQKMGENELAKNILNYELVSSIFKLQDELQNIETRTKNSQVISKINTEANSNNLLIILLGLILGFISGFFIALISGLVKNFKESNA